MEKGTAKSANAPYQFYLLEVPRFSFKLVNNYDSWKQKSLNQWAVEHYQQRWHWRVGSWTKEVGGERDSSATCLGEWRV